MTMQFSLMLLSNKRYMHATVYIGYYTTVADILGAIKGKVHSECLLSVGGMPRWLIDV